MSSVHPLIYRLTPIPMPTHPVVDSKNVIVINQKPMTVSFMEMTIFDAFREFDKRNPSFVGCSTFYSLRPQHVKIASPHETYMCIYHENMYLL
jgi:hypothetical protein